MSNEFITPDKIDYVYLLPCNHYSPISLLANRMIICPTCGKFFELVDPKPIKQIFKPVKLK